MRAGQPATARIPDPLGGEINILADRERLGPLLGSIREG
jgi:hypothetical protein